MCCGNFLLFVSLPCRQFSSCVHRLARMKGPNLCSFRCLGGVRTHTCSFGSTRCHHSMRLEGRRVPRGTGVPGVRVGHHRRGSNVVSPSPLLLLRPTTPRHVVSRGTLDARSLALERPGSLGLLVPLSLCVRLSVSLSLLSTTTTTTIISSFVSLAGMHTLQYERHQASHAYTTTTYPI